MSPATLGMDLKKTDNAEAQREKEKVTLHVRGKITAVLSDVLPALIERVMMVNDLIHGPAAKEYEVSVRFGEYAAPDFGTTVDTVVKAKQGGVMSIEQSIEELYGDSWTQEDKDAEVERLKAEQGLVDMEEPFDGADAFGSEGEDGNTANRQEGLSDDEGGSE